MLDTFEAEIKCSLKLALNDFALANSYWAAVDEIAREARKLPPDEPIGPFWPLVRQSMLEAALNRVWRMAVDKGDDSHLLKRMIVRMRSKPEYFTNEALNDRRQRLGLEGEVRSANFLSSLDKAEIGLANNVFESVDALRTTTLAHKLRKEQHKGTDLTDLVISKQDWERALDSACHAYNLIRFLFDGTPSTDCRGQMVMEPDIRDATAHVFRASTTDSRPQLAE